MKHILFLGLLLSAQFAIGQNKQPLLENRIYKNTIYTVLAYNTKEEQSPPILQLGSGEQIAFEFDELGRSNSNYYYSVEHCTSDWKLSEISRLDYLEGFSSERLNDYKISFNTIQPYTHYELKLPNQLTKFKISGNYILKIFERGKESTPIITQRFYVLNNQASLKVELVPSTNVNHRNSHQRVDFNLQHPFPISNPNSDVKAVVMQNLNTYTARYFTKPNGIRNGTLIYSDIALNDFPAGAEFRKFDMRTLRFKGINIQDIHRDRENTVTLSTDDALSNLRHSSQQDENGNFFVRNLDGRDAKYDADYARVFFRLKASKPDETGKAYVIGRFNNYRISPESELTYNEDLKAFQGNSLFKQGVYDYQYIWVTATNEIDKRPFEGNFYETENTYQVFVYFKKPGARWEELIAYSNINTKQSRN